MTPIYIGYDPREQDAWDVCKFSMERHSSIPLEFHQIDCHDPDYHRKAKVIDGQRVDIQDGKPFSTDFSFARFLVPFQRHEGWGLFVDLDFLFLADVKELFDLADDRYAVMVAKHLHLPVEKTKFLGNAQQQYWRKNWSSLILWNFDHPSNRSLKLNDVNTQPGKWLHGFNWLENDEIGSLPITWNYLVGYYAAVEPAYSTYGPLKALHYTSGGPWFEETRECDYAALWLDERELMNKQAKLQEAS